MLEKRSFNLAVLYAHLAGGPKDQSEISRLMNIAAYTATDYCKYLEEVGYVKHEYLNLTGRRHKVYSITGKNNYPYPRQYLECADPQREYFDATYPGIHKELRDAIYEGRISPSVVKTHREVDSPHWEIKKKEAAFYAGNFKSSLGGGEYNG